MIKLYIIGSLKTLPEFNGKRQEYIKKIVRRAIGFYSEGVDLWFMMIPALLISNISAVFLDSFIQTFFLRILVYLAGASLWLVVYVAFISLFIVAKVRKQIENDKNTQ